MLIYITKKLPGFTSLQSCEYAARIKSISIVNISKQPYWAKGLRTVHSRISKSVRCDVFNKAVVFFLDTFQWIKHRLLSWLRRLTARE